MLRKLLLAVVTVVVSLSIVLFLALQDKHARPAVGKKNLAEGAAGSIEYFTGGQGPVVVLLPSFARAASDFNELAAQLNEAGYRTLAINGRGVGDSALGPMGVSYYDLAGDIQAVLKQEGIDQPVNVLGHAFGNRIGRAFSSRYPQQVRALVLLSAGGEAPSPKIVSEAVPTILFGFWSESARVSAVERAFFAPGNSVPDYWISGWYPLASLIQTGAISATEAGWADGGTAPVLILQAMHDAAAPPELAGKVVAARLAERGQYVELADSGHASLPEQPDLIAGHVITFLDKQ